MNIIFDARSCTRRRDKRAACLKLAPACRIDGPTSDASGCPLDVWFAPDRHRIANIPLTGVCTENSSSDIMVMQSAKDRMGMDTSSSLNWARERRVLI